MPLLLVAMPLLLVASLLSNALPFPSFSSLSAHRERHRERAVGRMGHPGWWSSVAGVAGVAVGGRDGQTVTAWQ